jgi:polysaccharide biosynthesis transport protein
VIQGHRSQGHHSRKFYVLIFVAVFTAVMGGTAVYTFSQPHLYQSTAKIQFFREGEVIEFGEMVKIMRSPLITSKVAERMTTPPNRDSHSLDLQAVLSPYNLPPEAGVSEIEKLLSSNRKIIAHTDTDIIEVQYRHPDRHVAAKIANMFTDELIAYNARIRIDKAMIEVEALKVKAEQQERKVKAVEQLLLSYKNAHPTLTSEALEADPAYRALSVQLTTENQVLRKLIERMRDTTMM